MQRNVVNHHLDLNYESFLSMNEDLSFHSIGKYAIFEKIGEGAYGKVYKGSNEATKQEVAVKVINVAKVHQYQNERLKQITLRLIKNEDLLMRGCNSPNLVKCYDVYQNESLKLMMVEYCNGGNLEEYIQKKGRIPEKQAILIFKQILNGIAECHSHMIIHRDLKSQNVLIHNGVFKVADFGFSKILDVGIIEENTVGNQKKNENLAIKNDNKCVGGTSLGTITNMAPEVMARKPYGLKADIWSAGIILFQMVFGNFPFQSRDKKTLITEIQGTMIFKPKLIKFNGYTASAEISDFIKRLLVFDHNHRIGWKQLLTHPIFNTNKGERVPRSQVFDFPLVPLMAPLEIEENSCNLGENISNIIKKLNVNVVYQDSMKVIRRMSKIKSQKAITEQTQTFEWMNENLVQCLKVELIYQEIILKLETYKMIDFDERESIELMYLLINRCFLSISPINDQMSKLSEKNLFIKQTYGIIKTLYQKVYQVFLRYSKMLTKEEDKFTNKVSDFFKSKQEILMVDKFLNGIQNYDFQRQEQLLFIQKNYIDKVKNILKGPEEVREKVRKLLGNYSNINKIQFKHLQKIDFDTYVQGLL